MIEHVAGCVDVRAGMSRYLHFGVVSERAVLHTGREPEKLADTVLGAPLGHVGRVPVADVEDSAVIVDLPSNGYEVVAAGGRVACWGVVVAVGGGVCGGESGGEGEDCERRGAW